VLDRPAAEEPREPIGADDIADALGKPRPTPQQRAVIESPLTPALVVAGAGSGKTETMANRVLWLLANGHVRAGEILGLTFTRKAASELGERIRDRIDALAHAGLVPGHDPFELPTVATYNSFANRIYRDNAVLLGRESDGAVLSDASAWQLARSIVTASTDERLPESDKSVDALTKAVLALDAALSENVADGDAVADFALEFAALEQLPPGGKGTYEDRMGFVRDVGALPELCRLAGELAEAKQRRGAVAYSDQVALALRIAERFPRLGEELRGEYKVVLLDEYQDTSVVQTRLLATLFRGCPVMAVGDPHQSIYGWRGASAANLDEFADHFADGRLERFSLSTSWRNGIRILDIANELVRPLTARSRVEVDTLRPGPTASDLPVRVVVEETIADEADQVARWFAGHLREQPDATAALLLRARKTLPFYLTAFREHDVKFHVLGVGGLLQEPEIADLVSALRVVHDPTAGSELVRLLAGSKWRIGVKDLHALHSLASWLRDRDYATRPIDPEVRDKMRASFADDEGGSIIDALDFVASRTEHSKFAAFSADGLARLQDAGRLLSRLRARTGLDLLDFVSFVQQELLLDIEVGANESLAMGGANFEALFDAVGSYIAVDDVATLGGFLAWLREAEQRDDLSPRPEDPEPGSVQILTIHGSKGLEWDLVAVPRLVAEELPARPLDGTSGWLSFGGLPYEFRGDRNELPVLGWRAATTRKELLDAVDTFKKEVKDRQQLEERRLAYVAVTRARHSLLLSASFWATQKSCRKPSVFLQDLVAAGLLPELPLASTLEENPLGEQVSRFFWPRDPLGGRREAVERAAELVRAARPGAEGTWQRHLDVLLAEREERLRGETAVQLPIRVPASRFKDYVTDPAGIAKTLRRPMPERPYRATRLGTLFHDWVEDRFGVRGGSEELDAVPGELDDRGMQLEDEAQLVRLQQVFERSEWASRRPVEVERELHIEFEGHVVVCKIDAVYETDGRFQIVDWKTGKAPRDADDLAGKRLQLALYRLAFARWKQIDPELVDAVFYFVADDQVVRPDTLETEEQLRRRWRAALG
jgi:DNA helicase-2/ATP-dependent DNA helicase PcrA